MNTPKRSYIIPALAFIVAGLGFFIPFWPLTALGVALAALGGHGVFAVGLGLLLDLAYGPPPGIFQIVMFPFAFVALALVLVRLLTARYFVDSSSGDTL